MKTLVDIDEELLRRAMLAMAAPTKKAAVNSALVDVVRRYEASAYLDELRAGLAKDLDDPELVAQAQR